MRFILNLFSDNTPKSLDDIKKDNVETLKNMEKIGGGKRNAATTDKWSFQPSRPTFKQ